MKVEFSKKYQDKREEILDFINRFNETGTMLNDGKRNSIKIFDLTGQSINIKSFKIPNLINRVVYKYFRKSKAERSFKYAEFLISKNIGTPAPVAYVEDNSSLLFKHSYYISENLSYDLTYRELVKDPDYLNHEAILRAFTRFTYRLHENEVMFLDHSPGNTLIQIQNKDYKFFLVDLNRIKLKPMSFDEKMKNFSRLTPKKEMVKVMADEYSKLIEKDSKKVFEKMWFYTDGFQKKFLRKKELKKKLKL